MDHIFGNSDDIAFGAGSKNPLPPEPKKPSFSEKRSFNQSSSRPERAPRVERSPRQEQPRQERAPRPAPQQYEPPSLGDSPALSRLIAGMKPSFLPNEDDMNLIRCVILSDEGVKDPLLLFRSDATTVLVGSGFGQISRAGKSYPTFPDMRLIFSEKERLNAWILTDETMSVELFEYILPTLEFPPIYATRELIAKFRNSINDTQFLDKCRFFELFTPGVSTRRIGDVEFFIGSNTTESILSIRATSTTIGLSLFPSSLPSSGTTPGLFLEKKESAFALAGEKVESGEILMLRGKTYTRHTLKYTFDTFYVDNSSIGIVAGYTLGDREMLAENGVLTFTLEEDSRARTIAGHIFIDSRGFVHAHEMMPVHKEILKGIRATYEKLITDNERIERGDLVQSMRREITKYCFLLTGRTPVVMPIIIER